ncbi:MAG: PKD domain-containing protein [Bacteroidetes bacterium]|nr:PKD domain-containing protein [Bacteroidota bacterium]
MKTKTLLNSILKSCLALFIASNAYAQCSLSVIKRDSSSCSLKGFYSSDQNVDWQIKDGYGRIIANNFGNTIPGYSYFPYNSFNRNGNYVVTAISETNPNCNASYSLNINCLGNMDQCHASFTYTTNPSNCYTYFTNTSAGTNLSYKWYYSYNGGSIISLGTTTNVVVPMALSNGTNNIGLAIYSNGFYCDSTSQILNINCTPPVTPTCNASYIYSTDINCVTHFTNTSTGSGNLTYYWSEKIGNSYASLSFASNPSLSLSNGTHSIVLTSSSNGNYCDTTMQTVNIACGGTVVPSCQVTSSITLFVDNANPGNYFCYNQSTGSGILTYLWDFGDGTTSTQQYPFHQYAQPGNYPVCLTTTNTNGTLTCSATDCDSSSVQRMAAGFLMSSINVIPQSVTGIKNTTNDFKLNAYPNPMNDALYIEFVSSTKTKHMAVIVDAIGREVIRKSLEKTEETINTSALEKGYYSLIIVDEKETAIKTIKLVK